MEEPRRVIVINNSVNQMEIQNSVFCACLGGDRTPCRCSSVGDVQGRTSSKGKEKKQKEKETLRNKTGMDMKQHVAYSEVRNKLRYRAHGTAFVPWVEGVAGVELAREFKLRKENGKQCMKNRFL